MSSIARLSKAVMPWKFDQTHNKPRWTKKNALERAILSHYERLNQAIANGANESAFADIQDQIREKEQRLSEIVDEMTSVSSLLIDESDVHDALGRFDEVWTALSPAERAKAIHQIVDSIQYDGHSKEVNNRRSSEMGA